MLLLRVRRQIVFGFSSVGLAAKGVPPMTGAQAHRRGRGTNSRISHEMRFLPHELRQTD